MYAKPHVRPLDATTAVSSCTPCDAKWGAWDGLSVTTEWGTVTTPTVYVSKPYSQVGPVALCYTLPVEPPGGSVSTRANVRIYTDLPDIIGVA